MSRNQVNVRLSDEENAELEKLAKLHNKSKSEIVRTAFQGELAKIDSKKNKSLSDEERKDMLVKIGTMMTYLSDVRNHTSRMSGHTNQMAKMMNQMQIPRVTGFDEAVAYSEHVKENLEVMSEELNKIWHTLV